MEDVKSFAGQYTVGVIIMWLCPQCGLENTEDRVVCKDCGGLRGHEAGTGKTKDLEELFFDW